MLDIAADIARLSDDARQALSGTYSPGFGAWGAYTTRAAAAELVRARFCRIDTESEAARERPSCWDALVVVDGQRGAKAAALAQSFQIGSRGCIPWSDMSDDDAEKEFAAIAARKRDERAAARRAKRGVA